MIRVVLQELPFAFASHFAAAQMIPAVEIYRADFRPSPKLAAPYLMLGINTVSADSDDEAGCWRIQLLERGMITRSGSTNGSRSRAA